MARNSGRMRRAVNASSNELVVALGENIPIPDLAILRSSELGGEEKDAIWTLFEENMRDLYSASSFGWAPVKRKEEIFHSLSRFLLVQDPEKRTTLLAFCMFRFENEEGENVIYCYDIQVASHHHRSGVGRKLVQILYSIGEAFGMEKILLTVLKANRNAMAFYRACGFQVDPNSPSRFLPEDDSRRDNFDYEIMSKEVGL